MSILTEVLEEELDRLNRQEVAYNNAIQELPKGYISKKNIRGKETYYLQHRDGDKIISKWVPIGNLQNMIDQIERRKQLEASLRRVKQDKKRLQKAIRW